MRRHSFYSCVWSRVFAGAFWFMLIAALSSTGRPVQAGGTVSECNEAGLSAALSDGGTITFGCSGTITLTQSLPITASTTMDGTGQSVVIDGNHNLRIFTEIAAGVTLRLIGLTVANGQTPAIGLAKQGGAIMNSGTVEIIRCLFTGNKAFSGYTFGGAIFNTGTLRIQSSVFSDNSASSVGSFGGAIINQGGDVVIADSSFVNNTVNSFGSSGGAIENQGTMTISGCTFQGNQALGGDTYSLGGAIGNSTNGTLTVLNSTFYGNTATAQGGAISQGTGQGTGSLTITNSTFSGNSAPGAGGTLQGAILLRNSIIASAGGMACVGTITDGGGNLRWTGADSSCPGLNGNPLLGPLQNNGGQTFTMALGTGSSALLLASANCPPRDQRSLVRPNLPQCDSGAYEFGGIPALNCFLPLVTR